MQKKIIPAILTIALIISGFFALYSIGNVQGNARVVNYTGIVRGATQKLVKEEMSGEPDDALITHLDKIIEGLQTGEGDDNLVYLNDEAYQRQLSVVQEKWTEIKKEIQNVRQGGGHETLYRLSQEYFAETDRVVHDAEAYTERRVQHAKWGLILLTGVWLLVAAFVGFFTSRVSRRQHEIEQIEDENRKKSEYLSVLAKQLQAPMNEMSELLYITDIETYELLFLNEAGQRSFNIDNFYGQMCYQVIQGRDSPCPFCNNNILKEGENISWEYTNPVTRRHYLLKDRKILWDNRRAKMEIAFDLTENENKKQQLQYLLDAEQMIIDCIHVLYKKQNVNQNIQEVLNIVGKFLRADCAYYIDIEHNRLVVKQEWHQDNGHVLKIEYQNLSDEIIERWIKTFERQKCLVIEDIETLKADRPEEYEMLTRCDIHCMIASSLEYNGKISGFIGLNNPPADRVQHIVSFLQTLSYFIDLSIQQDRAQNQLAQLSYHDMLTSFYNRNRYMEDVQKLEENDQEIGVIYLDINGLKDINDTFGHARGDEVITEAAKYMKEVFPGDYIYRIGGDEFVILCLHMEEMAFINRVRRLKNMVQENKYLKIALGYRWSRHSSELLSLIKEADADMYEDKRIYYHNHSKSRRYRHNSDELLYLANEMILKEELERGSFQIYLQPKICSKNNRLEGAEALIRYRNKNGQIFLPKDFLPLLEEHHLISLVDYYVFEQVCSLIHQWRVNGTRVISVSVNLSQQSMIKVSLNRDLLEICGRYEVSPSDMELEISEHVNEVTEKELISLIHSLKRDRFRIALDDFGKAFANFALLSSNDFDVLKIDRSIVAKLGSDIRTKMIVDSISELCQKLKIDIVAEGIETQDQLDALTSSNIYIVQGFFYDRPITIDQFEQRYINKNLSSQLSAPQLPPCKVAAAEQLHT